MCADAAQKHDNKRSRAHHRDYPATRNVQRCSNVRSCQTPLPTDGPDTRTIQRIAPCDAKRLTTETEDTKKTKPPIVAVQGIYLTNPQKHLRHKNPTWCYRQQQMRASFPSTLADPSGQNPSNLRHPSGITPTSRPRAAACFQLKKAPSLLEAKRPSSDCPYQRSPAPAAREPPETPESRSR